MEFQVLRDLNQLDIIKYTKNLAMANKESIICGWQFINQKLKK